MNSVRRTRNLWLCSTAAAQAISVCCRQQKKWRSWKNQDYDLIGKKTDYSLFERTDMYLWYGVRGCVDKKLSAGLETLKKNGYPFETKIFTNLGHGGLAGEHPKAFLQEVQAAHRHTVEQ